MGRHTEQRTLAASTQHATTDEQMNTCCPLLIGDPYIANKVCELVTGNSFFVRRICLKMWKCDSPMCTRGTSEDNLYHFCFCCPLYNEISTDVARLNLMMKIDCEKLKNYNFNANKLKIQTHELYH